MTSTPTRLETARKAQAEDRRRLEEIRDRMRDRARRIAAFVRRVRMARRLRRHNVRSPYLVLDEADRAGLGRALALAVLERETGMPQRNIFGHDAGGLFPGLPVTHERVVALLGSATGANGVGWTQLTWRPFVERAERMGGAHLPRYQMRVGFSVLADNVDRLGMLEGVAAYNGSGPAAIAYANDVVMVKAPKWREVLEV